MTIQKIKFYRFLIFQSFITCIDQNKRSGRTELEASRNNFVRMYKTDGD